MGVGVEGDELANGLVACSRIRTRISREDEVGKTYTPLVLGEKQASFLCGVVQEKDEMFFDIFYICKLRLALETYATPYEGNTYTRNLRGVPPDLLELLELI